LLDDLWANDDPTRRIDVVLLSQERDGIAQVTEALAEFAGDELDAVHFVTHGTDRAIKLGSTWLDVAAFNDNLALIESWSFALGDDADLLFYGCDLASTEAGRSLLDGIATATGADLAASVDDTGSALLGGNWELEYTLGSVETDVAISYETQVGWAGLLNTFTVTTTNGTGAGSLHQAILDANSLAGADTIAFAIPANDARHFYYADDGVAGQVTAGNITTTNDGSDQLLAGADPDFARSWWSIVVNSAGLPAITESVTIDASTQAGFIDSPIIELNGTNVSNGDPNGFTIESSYVTIRGFVINRFGDDGIEIDNDGGHNTIVGNYIGTDVSGTLSGYGNRYGITF